MPDDDASIRNASSERELELCQQDVLVVYGPRAEFNRTVEVGPLPVELGLHRLIQVPIQSQRIRRGSAGGGAWAREAELERVVVDIDSGIAGCQLPRAPLMLAWIEWPARGGI